ncbi:hypothetical protein EW093_11540 [Thiospirochaeta perfilievii]|uniref:6-bladed beta-propeller n=1 Tax=Thiospirochaeta perfilievii TaxID=252967 RepID=A0A5C1QD98_9SPIO|nr:hypothetical protein [Thiospirochaeta perfilievii]QEN05318.1 hypothetical protein EW093_11540 [Thiospirochaeta perfilievii]
MIKKTAILLLILFSLDIYAEEVSEYRGSLVKSFQVGDKSNQLGMDTSAEGGGTSETQPSAMFINKEDNLIIADTNNSRMLSLNKELSTSDAFGIGSNINYSLRLKEVDNILWGTTSNSRHYILDKTSGKSTELYIDNNLTLGSNCTIFTGNIIFTYLKDGSLASFVLEDRENLKFSKRLSEHETFKLFRNKKKYGLEGYTIDKSKRMFYNGQLLNTDFSTKFDYWKDLHKKNSLEVPRIIPGVPEYNKLDIMKGGSTYIGTDIDGNTYYDISQSLIIFDKDGWVLDYFFFKDRILIKPAVNSNGDVFYLLREGTKDVPVLNLYKIDRKW